MFTPVIIDARDVDKAEPESILGDYSTLAEAEQELADYLIFASKQGWVIVKSWIECR